MRLMWLSSRSSMVVNQCLFLFERRNIVFADCRCSPYWGQNQRESTGGKVWRENTRGKTEMVWTPTEERWWVCWERMLRMELPGKRKRGRPKRRFMDVVTEDMAEVEVTEEGSVDRNNRRRKIRCGDPWWEKPKEEEEAVGLECYRGGGATGIFLFFFLHDPFKLIVLHFHTESMST